MASAPYYFAKLAQLQNDRLPQFEDRFLRLWREQSTHNVTVLSTRLNNEAAEIRTRMDQVNDSLRGSSVQSGRLLGWTHGGVNLYLGKVGFIMFREAPRKLLPDELNNDGSPVYTFALCAGVDKTKVSSDRGWIWEMLPEVARGLELAGLVSPVVS